MSLQLLAEERVGSSIRAKERAEDERARKSEAELRRDMQLERI